MGGSITGFLNTFIIVGFVILLLVMLYQKRRDKKDAQVTDDAVSKKGDYEVNYVQDFLDFDKIYNNMIIRDNGTKFTMVIACSGINFDLMSEMEQSLVEEVFIELLNFIRFPIQLYVQTRRVDLKDSLKTYSSKIDSIEKEMKDIIQEINTLRSMGRANTERFDILNYELHRKQNLLEYATDLKKHIQGISSNKNVLQYKYHIVINYYIEELGLMNNFSEQEIYKVAFDELSSRSQSIIGALFGCGIKSNILDSNGLAELLYVAFNRDDAEKFRLKDNMEQGFYHLYATTENALMLQQNFEQPENDNKDKLLMLPNGFNLDLDKLSKELLEESA